MVIHNWVDTAKFAPTSEMRELGRRRWRCPDEKLIFLMVGSLYLPKGLHIAIQSFSKFVKTYRDACLLVAGSGRHEKTLKDLAQKCGLKIGGNIHFLGEVRHCNLPLIYNSADIFLMPSLFIEGLPYTLLEAMSCGLPFIAAEIGGVTEAAGDVGILVPPGDEKAMMDAMTHLAKNMEERINVGRSARRRVMELFSEEVARSKLISVLEKANQ